MDVPRHGGGIRARFNPAAGCLVRLHYGEALRSCMDSRPFCKLIAIGDRNETVLDIAVEHLNAFHIIYICKQRKFI